MKFANINIGSKIVTTTFTIRQLQQLWLAADRHLQVMKKANELAISSSNLSLKPVELPYSPEYIVSVERLLRDLDRSLESVCNRFEPETNK